MKKKSQEKNKNGKSIRKIKREKSEMRLSRTSILRSRVSKIPSGKKRKERSVESRKKRNKS
jgi:hypothetical protein